MDVFITTNEYVFSPEGGIKGDDGSAGNIVDNTSKEACSLSGNGAACDISARENIGLKVVGGKGGGENGGENGCIRAKGIANGNAGDGRGCGRDELSVVGGNKDIITGYGSIKCLEEVGIVIRQIIIRPNNEWSAIDGCNA